MFQSHVRLSRSLWVYKADGLLQAKGAIVFVVLWKYREQTMNSLRVTDVFFYCEQKTAACHRLSIDLSAFTAEAGPGTPCCLMINVILSMGGGIRPHHSLCATKHANSVLTVTNFHYTG